MSSNNSEGL